MITFTETGTIEFDTITSSGTYAITADGAQGGDFITNSGRVYAGGKGAAITGDIYLERGTVLELVIGEAGHTSLSPSTGGGGGGGSFVFETFTGNAALTPILIAGGGGGAAYFAIGGSGGTGTAGSDGAAGNGGAGGAGGQPGGGGGSFGGGGGGETGGDGGSPADPGSDNEASFAGGAPGNAGNSGGFGGGGGGYSGGGGGGGYGGGGGGDAFGGGGGGGSYDADLIANTVQAEPGQNAGNGFIEVDQLNTLCYLHGTRILTPTGAVAVEDLAIGDAVVTRFSGTRRIKWLGRQSYAPEFLTNNPDKFPVCIQAGALEAGVPARDLYVSPGHSMLLGDILVLARDMVNGITITQTRPETTQNYVQLDLGTHDCVLAEGAWSETYADAPGMRAQFHNAAEYEALYPDAPPAEALRLCASRPEAGPKLEAALRPVVARAGVTPGPLEGWLDCATDWQITGWARDMAHPEMPVLLEILTDDAVIGTVLARASRADLAAAGKGNCAFSFTPPSRLRGEAVTVRRSADGAALPRTEAMRKTA